MSFKIPEFYIIDLINDYYCTSCKQVYPCQMIDNMSSDKLCRCFNYVTKYNQPRKSIEKYYSVLICDYCRENFEELIKLDNKNYPIAIRDTTYEEIYDKKYDACYECFYKHNLVRESDDDKLKERSDTIHCKIEFEHVICDINFYVVYECNNISYNQSCAYYLVGIKNNNIVLSYKLDSYNPYFGVEVQNITMDDNDIVTISYNEKHCLCQVKLEMDKESLVTSYINNGMFYVDPIGKVIEFKKDGEITSNGRYFDIV
jgi:hypothetical protein